jgi:hypothetical protein
MSKIVWAFDITSPGAINTSIETAYSGGILVAPTKFPATFTPRSAERVKIIEKEFQEANVFLQQFK